MLDIVLLIVGLALIVYGADFLTDGASAIGRKCGLSDLVVGLTIVAFGTSAPELSISVISAVQGNAGIAIGNVIGSNLFNTLVIVGVVAVIAPIRIERSIMTNELPMVIVSTIAVVAIGCSQWLDGVQPMVARVDGILLLLFFAIFMRYVFSKAKDAEAPSSDASVSKPEKKLPVWRAVLYVAGGLAALVWGGDLFVDKASAIAKSLGVSDAVVGLTIVAAGTSLPELATSVNAAIKGNTGIAIGNVIGSNIFNILMVLGCSSVVRELPFDGVGMLDLGALLVSALLFWMFGWLIKVRTITRTEGAVMVAIYVGYIAWLVANINK
ncbi:MAG: calcium/sodium antiporter [Muribaculaceae bacterium]|nr:calcium/sodium antiporter [Muribaculaceae bacterium]